MYTPYWKIHPLKVKNAWKKSIKKNEYPMKKYILCVGNWMLTLCYYTKIGYWGKWMSQVENACWVHGIACLHGKDKYTHTFLMKNGHLHDKNACPWHVLQTTMAYTLNGSPLAHMNGFHKNKNENGCSSIMYDWC